MRVEPFLAADVVATYRVGAGSAGAARSGLAAAVAGLRVEAAAVLDACDSPVSGEVTPAVSGLGRVEGMLTAARARLIAEADLAGLPAAAGFVNLGAWTADTLGLTGRGGAAEAKLAVGLAGQPQVLGSLEAGSISREHAAGILEGIARQQAEADAQAREAVAAEDERRRQQQLADARAQMAAKNAEEARQLALAAAKAEAQRRADAAAARQAAQAEADAKAHAAREALLDQATNGATADQVRRQARELADTEQARARSEAAQQARRQAKTWFNDQTRMGRLEWDLPAEPFEALQTLLAAITPIDPPDTPQELRRTRGQRLADGLADAIGLLLSTGELPQRGGENPHVTVRVPIGALVDRPELGGHDEPAVTAHDVVLSIEAARRLICEATLHRAMTAGSAVLDIGRASRQWTVAQRRAIELRDGHCRFPGCRRDVRWTQIHHIKWWRHGGRSDIANGCLLCAWHHNAVHHDGWALHLNTKTAQVTVTKHGTELTSQPALQPDPHPDWSDRLPL